MVANHDMPCSLELSWRLNTIVESCLMENMKCPGTPRVISVHGREALLYCRSMDNIVGLGYPPPRRREENGVHGAP